MSSRSAEKKTWIILDLLTWGTAYLSEKGFDESRLTVELLLAHVLHIQRIQLYTNFDKPLAERELAEFKELLKRRLTHEPVQYILGSTEFMGLPFFVDSRVLIPRPETEILVEQVVTKCRQRFSEKEKIFAEDLGTGSGCIAISLAVFLNTLHCRAVDVSRDALNVAKHNAEANNVETKIEFEEQNIFMLQSQRRVEPLDCIISNPPYVSLKEFGAASPDVTQFEPRSALTDEEEGLRFYPALAHYAEQNLNAGGFLAVEHQYDQSERVQKIFQEHGLTVTDVVKDYGGHYRCVIAEKQ
ncbi:MAG: peptide chain release factor N(5)-glutamine methyltransferase [Bacteroidetes bacterium]|nr:peptide chain release factor N(5)-glutamine methyltransferase [Bacteroidota bacterium]